MKAHMTTWKSADGTVRDIKALDTPHLKNIKRLLERRTALLQSFATMHPEAMSAESKAAFQTVQTDDVWPVYTAVCEELERRDSIATARMSYEGDAIPFMRNGNVVELSRDHASSALTWAVHAFKEVGKGVRLNDSAAYQEFTKRVSLHAKPVATRDMPKPVTRHDMLKDPNLQGLIIDGRLFIGVDGVNWKMADNAPNPKVCTVRELADGKAPRRHGYSWTEAEDVLVKKYFTSGMNINTIAKLLERTQSAITFRLEHHGLISY